MAQYLYVCHFSNGHIKVGRSLSPMARIAQHEARVSCLGVELVEHFIAECVGPVVVAESKLIDRCVEAASKRNKNEWFEGIEYADVCEWLKTEAESETVGAETDPCVAEEKRIDSADKNHEDPAGTSAITSALFSRARRLAVLSVAMMSMETEQADCVYEALNLADQFIVNDCSAFSEDLSSSGVGIDQQATSLVSHAFEIAKAQYKYWWRGFPSREPFPMDHSRDYDCQRALLGV